MNRFTAALALAAAFAAGCGATHFLRPAIAAENITAQVISTGVQRLRQAYCPPISW